MILTARRVCAISASCLLLATAAWSDAQGITDFDPPPAPPWQTHLDGPRVAAVARAVGRTIESSSLESAAPPAVEADPQALPAEIEGVRGTVARALAIQYPRALNTRDNSSWEIMHSIIAYGVHSEVFRGGPHGEPVSGIGWLCFNGYCRGGYILTLDKGRIAARRGVDVQGHHGQLLAILAQSHLSPDYPMQVEGRKFTLVDLIESEKLGCEPNSELTFKLISLMHYLDSDAQWKNFAGQPWSISRLIQEEIKAPIRGAACGGTHRLMGLSYAVNKRKERGEPMDGQFARAQKYINEYHRYTFALQNPDGSFSTEWFARRGDRPDLDRKLQTTGHMLEWLVFSLSDEELKDPHVTRAVAFLSGLIVQYPDRKWEIGPIGHGLHALAMYNERMFGVEGGFQPPALAAHQRQATHLPELTQVGATLDRHATPVPTATYPRTTGVEFSLDLLPSASVGSLPSHATR